MSDNEALLVAFEATMKFLTAANTVKLHTESALREHLAEMRKDGWPRYIEYRHVVFISNHVHAGKDMYVVSARRGGTPTSYFPEADALCAWLTGMFALKLFRGEDETHEHSNNR